MTLKHKEKRVKNMKQDMIVILDLGSHHNTVVARAIRALGALKRVIRQLIENPLAKLILEGKFIGKTLIKIDVADEQITFS